MWEWFFFCAKMTLCAPFPINSVLGVYIGSSLATSHRACPPASLVPLDRPRSARSRAWPARSQSGSAALVGQVTTSVKPASQPYVPGTPGVSRYMSVEAQRSGKPTGVRHGGLPQWYLEYVLAAPPGKLRQGAFLITWIALCMWWGPEKRVWGLDNGGERCHRDSTHDTHGKHRVFVRGRLSRQLAWGGDQREGSRNFKVDREDLMIRVPTVECSLKLDQCHSC